MGGRQGKRKGGWIEAINSPGAPDGRMARGPSGFWPAMLVVSERGGGGRVRVSLPGRVRGWFRHVAA